MLLCFCFFLFSMNVDISRVIFRVLSSVSQLSTCGIKHIGRRVQSCFTGILDNAYDETNTYNLHCNIIGDTK